MSEKKRIAYLDNVRAICMLYIVGFWHMQEYTEYGLYTPVTQAITRGVLATFVFISAYLAGKKKIDNLDDVKRFCKKRLLRIYPLFFLACTTLYLIHLVWGKNYILDTAQYIRALLGISFIITPAPSTVWFINMLIIFDIIAVLVNSIKGFRWKTLTCTAVVGTVFLLKYLFDGIDDRILIYCPVYCVALLVSAVGNLPERTNYYILFGGLLAFVMLCPFAERNIFSNILVTMICVGVLLEIGKLCVIKGLSTLLAWLSYGSMCAYLFHRQILFVVYGCIGPFPIWFALIVMLPVVIILSWCIQKGYDNLFELKVLKRN
ncbi:MAG: acyltransferase [Lachnospiraceae bacterium]|nr:acyltransferase [Lachnospiraceae bacterium]